MRTIFSFLLSSVAIACLLPSLAFAACTNNPYSFGGFTSFCSLNDLIAALMRLFTELGLIVVVVYIVIDGFMFVFALGNPEKLQRAKRHFAYSMIAAVVVMGAWTLINLFEATAVQIIAH